MPQISNYPGGFAAGLTIRGMPIAITHPGKMFWVSNSGVFSDRQIGSSDGNDGTFDRPFSTLTGALSKCTAHRGDIIMIKPGHAESVIAAAGIALSKAGVAIVGLGTGTKRPTFTFTTANTATITVTADNISVTNCVFVGNFLSVAVCFALTAAKNFSVTNCYFNDTSTILNFLAILSTAAGANACDGLIFSDNVVQNLGVTSNNTVLNLGGTMDGLVAERNLINWAVQNNKPILADVTTGILTRCFVSENRGYRPNTTTAGGSLIKVGGSTSTGWVVRNYVQTLTTGTDLLFTTTVGLGSFENRVSGVVGATGFVIPAVDS